MGEQHTPSRLGRIEHVQSHDVMTTYRRADGEPCGDAETWTTSARYLPEEWDENGNPILWVAEQWQRVKVDVFTVPSNTPQGHVPTLCRKAIGACDECMVAYQLAPGADRG